MNYVSRLHIIPERAWLNLAGVSDAGDGALAAGGALAAAGLQVQ